MNEQKSKRKKRTGLLLLVLALLAAVGAGLGLWQVGQPDAISFLRPTQTAVSAYQTTAARRGDLAVSVSGSGSVVASQTADLAFRVPGDVAVLNVQVGDQVTAGQVLAQLDNLVALELAVQNQELAVRTVQQTLAELQSGGAAALAQARADLAGAEAAYTEAQEDLHRTGDSRCAPSKTQEYYFAYLYAQQRVDEWEGYLDDPNTGYGRDYILEKLAPMRKERDQAYANMVYCQGYTEQEIEDSQANLQLSKAELAQAGAIYQTLQASQGVDVQAVEIAQAELDTARLHLAKAQNDLSGATLTASIDGTVMAVNGSAGQAAGTGVFISLAVLDEPLVQASFDETDLTNVAAGCAALVTFDSLPGETFSGLIREVSPALVTVREVGMVQGLVDLENGQSASGRTLPVGLTGSVEVTCQQANNALLIPAQALYASNGQSTYVYVLDGQGRPERREVQVGIATVALAEITGGLEEGEPVITSPVEEN